MENIGKYRVQRVLGRGGMGTVYEAIDPLINRKIALKTMMPGLADNPDLRARFFREAQAAGGLRHRNIVTVYDLGEDKGQPYIAMEFIEGTDIEKIIQNKEPYSIEWKLDVLRQVCNGLAYAHRNGIVHRDVKPANIRVTPDGEVKIMDFGIAHLQSSTLTKSGPVLGTVHYMAPEQLDGHKVDHRADVFSVGAIAYELVAYRRPFDGESLTAVMYKITHEPADRSGLPATGYSPGLEHIILKALARDPKERYQSLDEMHDEIERLVRDTAARVLPAASEERGARVARLVEEGRRHLKDGHPAQAVASAKDALALAAADAWAQALLRDAEAEALRRRVEGEMAEIRTEIERARAEARLPKALSLCRRLLDLNPDDAALTQVAKDIETAIQDGEVEQLCGLALAYAADGDTELALKIAAKIERIAPKNPRYVQLKTYLDEESARHRAEAATAAAREHLVQGHLTEARAAAEEALAAEPNHAAAREIRDRVAAVLTSRDRARSEPAEPRAVTPGPAKTSPAPEPPRPPAPPKPATAPAPPATRPATGAPPPGPPGPPARPAASAPSATRPAAGPTAPVAPPAARPAAGGPPANPAAQAGTGSPGPQAPAPLTRPGAVPPSPVSPVARPAVATTLQNAVPAPTPPRPAPAAVRLPLAAPRPEPPAPTPTRPAPATPPAAVAPKPVSPTPVPGGLSPEAAARKADVESLTTAALNHFVQNEYVKARKAVEKALALDPQNRKGKELLKILGTLG